MTIDQIAHGNHVGVSPESPIWISFLLLINFLAL